MSPDELANCSWPDLPPRYAAELARRFFGVSTIEERQLAARALADRTIRARGFFEWDSEKIPVPED